MSCTLELLKAVSQLRSGRRQIPGLMFSTRERAFQCSKLHPLKKKPKCQSLFRQPRAADRCWTQAAHSFHSQPRALLLHSHSPHLGQLLRLSACVLAVQNSIAIATGFNPMRQAHQQELACANVLA